MSRCGTDYNRAWHHAGESHEPLLFLPSIMNREPGKAEVVLVGPSPGIQIVGQMPGFLYL